MAGRQTVKLAFVQYRTYTIIILKIFCPNLSQSEHTKVYLFQTTHSERKNNQNIKEKKQDFVGYSDLKNNVLLSCTRSSC